MKKSGKSYLLFLTSALFPLIFTIGSAGCKKDPDTRVIPILYPSAYIPAYPGSYWVYKEKGGTAVSTITTSSRYVLDSVKTYPNGFYTKRRVPKYDGQSLWRATQYNYIGTSYSKGWAPIPLLIDSAGRIGQEWVTWYMWDSPESDHRRIMIAVDTIMVVNHTEYNHVIGVRDYVQPGGIYISYDKYYAKDVGLICIRYYRPIQYFRITEPYAYVSPDSASSTMELTSYFINK